MKRAVPYWGRPFIDLFAAFHSMTWIPLSGDSVGYKVKGDSSGTARGQPHSASIFNGLPRDMPVGYEFTQHLKIIVIFSWKP